MDTRVKPAYDGGAGQVFYAQEKPSPARGGGSEEAQESLDLVTAGQSLRQSTIG